MNWWHISVHSSYLWWIVSPVTPVTSPRKTLDMDCFNFFSHIEFIIKSCWLYQIQSILPWSTPINLVQAVSSNLKVITFLFISFHTYPPKIYSLHSSQMDPWQNNKLYDIAPLLRYPPPPAFHPTRLMSTLLTTPPIASPPTVPSLASLESQCTPYSPTNFKNILLRASVLTHPSAWESFPQIIT